MNKYLLLFIFCLIAFSCIFVSLGLCKKYLKKEKSKDMVFIIVSILTVLIHYSGLVYHAFTDGEIDLENNLYLPVYPCNVIMWECTTISFLMLIKKKNSNLFNVFVDFVFLIGTVCGIVGLCANANFLNHPSLKDYDILRGLLSHVTLIFTCLYLNKMDYFKRNSINNFISITIGLCIFFFCGVYSNYVSALLGDNDINSMYVKEPPLEQYPFINIYTVIPTFLLAYLIIIIIKEKKIKEKEEYDIMKQERR